jgi:hypothetical protein
MAKAARNANSFEEEDQAAGASFEADGQDSVMVDLTDVQEMSFEAIPKGTYPVILDQLEYQLSKSSGQPMWNARFTVTSGEYQNRKLFTFISFSPKALPGTKKVLRILKPELLEGAFDPKAVAESGEMIGIECRVRVGIQEYEGTDRNRITDYMSPAKEGFVA